MKKIFIFVLTIIISLQICSFAQDMQSVPMNRMTPRNTYLWTGSCNIRDNADGTVTLNGRVKAFSRCDALTISFVLYQESAGGAWLAIWENTYTDYNLSSLYSPDYTVPVAPGRYQLYATHTAEHNGIVESGETYTEPLQVY